MRVLPVLFLLPLLSACATDPPPDAGPAVATVFVVERGWHTDVGLPTGPALGPLRPFERAFPGAQSLTFGFGERSYLQARHRTLGMLVRALFPSEGMILVTGLRTSPVAAFPNDRVIALPVSQAALERLTGFIASSVAWGADGRPRLVAKGPYEGGLFYASTGRYDLFETCNTWTARALQAAGEPVMSFGVVMVQQLADQLAAPAGEPMRFSGRS